MYLGQAAAGSKGSKASKGFAMDHLMHIRAVCACRIGSSCLKPSSRPTAADGQPGNWSRSGPCAQKPCALLVADRRGSRPRVSSRLALLQGVSPGPTGNPRTFAEAAAVSSTANDEHTERVRRSSVIRLPQRRNVGGRMLNGARRHPGNSVPSRMGGLGGAHGRFLGCRVRK